jgi:NAD-dependent dihydropyrimidine dehydrogenase PreA subunit
MLNCSWFCSSVLSDYFSLCLWPVMFCTLKTPRVDMVVVGFCPVGVFEIEHSQRVSY